MTEYGHCPLYFDIQKVLLHILISTKGFDFQDLEETLEHAFKRNLARGSVLIYR